MATPLLNTATDQSTFSAYQCLVIWSE